MKNRTQLIFLIGASVSGLLIAGSATLLAMSYSKLGKIEKQISTKIQTLTYLHAGNPFPSRENVDLELRNGEELQAWCESLLQNAREGQLDLDMRTPSKFMQLLVETRKGLQAAAGAGVLPQGFTFGFERYLSEGEGSVLPRPDHVSRLAQQLAIIERVSKILFEEGITRLISVKRQVFEGSRREHALSGITDSVGEIKPGDMYGKLRFDFEFDAPESAMMGIMNRVASNQLFMSVGLIDYNKRSPDVFESLIPEPGRTSVDPAAPPLTFGGEDDSSVEVDSQGRLFPSRYQRVVSGPDLEVPMVIRMELNVFRFAEVKSE
ncbi:MAG: Amuc_1100 family pilus-like protein [Verrucomicrobia bacterium]|nr:Amuc_1100 family pilus-like protein [Verrucomicrobiota bacterium]